MSAPHRKKDWRASASPRPCPSASHSGRRTQNVEFRVRPPLRSQPTGSTHTVGCAEERRRRQAAQHLPLVIVVQRHAIVGTLARTRGRSAPLPVAARAAARRRTAPTKSCESAICGFQRSEAGRRRGVNRAPVWGSKHERARNLGVAPCSNITQGDRVSSGETMHISTSRCSSTFIGDNSGASSGSSLSPTIGGGSTTKVARQRALSCPSLS